MLPVVDDDVVVGVVTDVFPKQRKGGQRAHRVKKKNQSSNILLSNDTLNFVWQRYLTTAL